MLNPTPTRKRSTTAFPIASRPSPIWAPTGVATAATCCLWEGSRPASVPSAARPATTTAFILFPTSAVSRTRRQMRFWVRFAGRRRAARALPCRSANCVLARQAALDPLPSLLSLRSCPRPPTRTRRQTLRIARFPTAKTVCQTPTTLLLAPRSMEHPPPRSMLRVHPTPGLHRLSSPRHARLLHTGSTRPSLLLQPLRPLCLASVRQQPSNECLLTTAALQTTRNSKIKGALPLPRMPTNTPSRESHSPSPQATTRPTTLLLVATLCNRFSNLNRPNPLANKHTLPLPLHNRRRLPLLRHHRQARRPPPWGHLRARPKAATCVSAWITSISLPYWVRETLVRSCSPRPKHPSNCMPSKY